MTDLLRRARSSRPVHRLAALALLLTFGVTAGTIAADGVGAPEELPSVSPLRIDLDRLGPFSTATLPLAFDVEAYEALRGRHAVTVDAFPLAAERRGGALRTVRLDLRRSDVSHATVVAATMVDGAVVEAPLPTPDVQIFRGSIVGEPGSVVYLALSPHGTHGYVRTGGTTQVISPGPFGGDRTPLIYTLDALPAGAVRWRDFVCGTIAHEAAAWPEEIWARLDGEGGLAGGPEPPCRRIEMAVDSDKEFSDVLFGGDLDASGAYALTLLGASSEICEREVNMSIDVVFVRLWTGSDPWTAEGTQSQLFQFRDHWNANMSHVDRHLAHYLSGRNLGGGVAWLSAVCHPSNAYGLSANLNGFFPYPLQDNSSQNWDVMVVTHEIGHNIGTVHTHDFCPPLDQCASSEYFGQCQDERVCTNAGTIMSYCHTCSGGLANVVLDFHPVVKQTIVNYLSSVGACYIGCVEPAPVIHVPADSPTIQEAILAVMPGGEVIVAAGTYNESIRPFGKAVHIRSVGGPAVTTIDAGGLGASVARFSNGETATTILEGFTLTGGTGTSVTLGGSANIVGGGIYIASASPTIRDCVIVDNSATFGGGVFNNGAAPTFEECVIVGNVASPSSGGGVFNFAGSAPQFVDTHFEANVANANGGAMSNQGSNPIVIDCTFVANEASGSGGAVRNIQSSAGQFSGSLFAENVAGSTGGAFVNDASGGTTVSNSTFCGNAPNDLNGQWTNGGGNTFLAACAVPGDLNGDGVVDGADLGLLLSSWGACPGCPADLNGDGTVDGADLGLLLSNWS